MHPLPPEALPSVHHFMFTLFGIPVTVAWPNLIAWIVVVAAFVVALWLRIPRWFG